MRQIVLDIETTGMNQDGLLYLNHRIIEIGMIELINRQVTGNILHYYLKPDCKINEEAYKIHGISESFLKNKPRFKDIFKNLLNFLHNAEIIVHNATFDIGFLDYEFSLLNLKIQKINDFCNILDTLTLARKLFPGKKNSLNALCNRYKIPTKDRSVHGALLDAKLLTKVYRFMTVKQEKIFFSNTPRNIQENYKINSRITGKVNKPMKILYATDIELKLHQKYLVNICNKRTKYLW
ncbi:DNA polymerase III, epsilon subunit [Buchnera aphidicola (Cinara tujafilina)]|uniref:DNA polymerase III subunit epsilon n=1 Tax=Buchnera aphidicola (Cinara tujafilina) TaxID=261317 RepID=F7WZ93_9GAMM|nr:DNA polymerase III subunit epsilon [Buchnera aphidicola]AEH39747.1 DNA polymerase III, epsilon subunit [Buchnera aphidicola (Cinara tujafilina)]